MTPRRTVAGFSVPIHSSPWQPFFLMSESRELDMAGRIVKRGIEWSLPEVHRTLYEVINHFLKVCDSFSLYFVTGCVHGKFW